MKVGVLATMAFALLIGFPLASMGVDSDGDGVQDDLDNCLNVPNAGSLDCDTDQDGYGNRCDGDFNEDGATDGADFTVFQTDFNSFTDGGTGTNMNCDGSVSSNDFFLFRPNFLSSVPPGPSGLSCAGPIAGGCPN